MADHERLLMVCLTNSPNQDGLLLGRAFEREGYDVDYFDFASGTNEKLLNLAKHTRPDIVFVTKGNTIRRSTYESIKEHVGKLVMWYPDVFLPTDVGYGSEFLAETLPAFDIVLACYRGLVHELARYNANCHFAPGYFDNHFYGVESLTPLDHQTFDCDAVFIGNNQRTYGRERIDFLRLAAGKCDLRVWGLGWTLRLPEPVVRMAQVGLTNSDRASKLRFKVWQGLSRARSPLHLTKLSKSVMGKELVDNAVSKAYRCAKIGLNVGTFGHIGRQNIDLGFSDRLYKCMGNDTLYLTPPISSIEEWFQDGRDLVVYRSAREFERAIDYYLQDETERLAIAHNGFRKVMAGHTIDVRIKQYRALIEGSPCPFDCRHGAR